MSRQHEIPAELIARLRSGRNCLDFVHTGTDEHMLELIFDDADLGRLLAMITDAPTIEVHRGDIARAKLLREAIRLCALDVVGGTPLADDNVLVVNAAAQAGPLVPSISGDGRVRLASGTAVQALSTIARDAIDLLAAELIATQDQSGRRRGDEPLPGRTCRLRVCAADDCGLFILDTSRPNNRRWCSMELCGNRSKIRAYRARNIE